MKLKMKIFLIVKQITDHKFNIPHFIRKIEEKLDMLVFAGVDQDQFGFSIAVKFHAYANSNDYYRTLAEKFIKSAKEFNWEEFKIALIMAHDNIDHTKYKTYNNTNINNNNNYRRINNVNTRQIPNRFHQNNSRYHNINNNNNNRNRNFSFHNRYNNNNNANYNNNRNTTMNNINNNNNNINQVSRQQLNNQNCRVCELFGKKSDNHTESTCFRLTPFFKDEIKYSKQRDLDYPQSSQRAKTINLIQSSNSLQIQDDTLPSVPDQNNVRLNSSGLHDSANRLSERLSYPDRDHWN